MENALYLLISTPRFLISYDLTAAKSEILESGRGNYYGITWNKDGSDLVLSHSGIDEQSLVDLATYAKSELGYLTIGSRRTWQFLSAPHQILWLDDVIVVTNTGRNAISKINPRDDSVVQRRYDEVLWDRLSENSLDGAHFNSLYYKSGTLYVLAHNFNKGAYIIEVEWPSLEEKGRRQVCGATGVHNLWVDEIGQFIVCDSNHEALINAETGEIFWSGQSGGLSRGLAASEDIILVGRSEKTPRVDRSFSETGLWVLDRRDFRTVDFHYLGHFGAVQEIRIVDEVDFCHHGRPLSIDALDGLRTRTRQIAKSRIAQIRAAESIVGKWQIASGMPNFDQHQSISAEGGDLLLCISRQQASTVRAKLCWRPGAGTAHASLIVGYEGPDDQNMAAALFEPADAGGIVGSIWINRGEWRRLCSERVPEVAIGTMYITIRFRITGMALELYLGDELFLSASANGSIIGRRVGIRLFGQLFKFSEIEASSD